MDLHTSVLYAQTENRKLIYKNKFWRKLIKESEYKGEDKNKKLKASFAIKKIQQAIWNHSKRHKMSSALRKNIKLMKQYLAKPQLWETPIAHIIPREPDFVSFGDACLITGGGFSSDLLFWWWLEWPDDIKSKTLKFIYKIYKEDGTFDLVSINILEFLVIIVQYLAATFQYRRHLNHKLTLPKSPQHPYPTLLNWADNRSAVKWAKDLAYKTKYGKGFSKILGAVNFGNPLGLFNQYLPGDKNFIADGISRFHSRNLHSQFSKLQQENPILKGCQRLIPTKKLTSILYSVLRQPQKFTLDLKALPIMELFVVENNSS